MVEMFSNAAPPFLGSSQSLSQNMQVNNFILWDNI